MWRRRHHHPAPRLISPLPNLLTVAIDVIEFGFPPRNSRHATHVDVVDAEVEEEAPSDPAPAVSIASSRTKNLQTNKIKLGG